jgi:ribosomal protein S18 acetylase RimI-like enzyme
MPHAKRLAKHRKKAQIKIRPMRKSDLAFIRRGLSETNWQDIPEDQKQVVSRDGCDRRIYEDFDRYLKNKRYKFKVFIASLKQLKNNLPAGYVSVGETVNPAVGLRYGAVLDFWVDPTFRNHGIGSQLLDYALSYIKSRGYTHSSILVSASNKEATRMYRRRGFYVDRLNLIKKLSMVRSEIQG